MTTDYANIQIFKTKDGKTIKTGVGYRNPEMDSPGQVVGLPSKWIWINEKWYRLDFYGIKKVIDYWK